MKPRRLFILRYSSSPYEDDQEFFLTLEEHLPGGTVVEFEADDVYRTFTDLNWTKEHIEFLLYQRKSTVAETRRHATWVRYLKAVVQRIASIPAGEAFCLILSSAVLVLSSGTSKKRRRLVRQQRDVFAETAAAREQYEAARERNRAAREERRRKRLKPCGTPAAYARGCRCDKCRRAMTRYSRQRSKARKKGDFRGFVPGEPARDHILKIIEAGGSLHVLSRLVNLTHSYLHGIKTGWRRNIRADRANAILLWRIDTVIGEKKIPTKPVREHVQTLAQQGITMSRIAETAGIETEKLEEALGRQFIPTWMSNAILALPAQTAS